MADHDEVNQGENEHNNAIPVRTLRDYLQPTRASTPSCIVFPNVVGNFEMKPGVIQLLPKFHGLDSENPYLHLKEFDEVCATLQYNNVTDDVVRLKLFPFSLKEKAKSWLHSLRPNTIRTWQEMTREFLKKFFPTHKTNTLRKNIMHFSQKENETFFQCWERFKDLLLACPHHGKCYMSRPMWPMLIGGPSVRLILKLIILIGKTTPILVGGMGPPLMNPKDLLHMHPMYHHIRRALRIHCRSFIQGQTQINQAVMQDIQELKNSVGRIDSKLNVREKGTFPAQPQPNPKTQFVVNEVQNPHIEHVKAITTLRSGKVIEKDIPKKVLPSKENQETKDDDGPNDKENKEDEERVFKPVAPFPQALLAHKKKETNQDILNVFRQVKVNIPLLDAIQQIPSYAKYLKDLCTVKRKHHVQKKAFLTEQVSAILQCNTPVKYKDPGCPTISCIIGNFNIDRALLDLGASVNLLPYSVYEQLGLGELKPTKVVLQLADRSIRKPRGIVEDVSGVLKLSFGNMTVELNIFNTCNQLKDEEDMHDIDLIETLDSYDKNSEISCTNSLFEFAQEMEVSNGKVQKEELVKS
uniref:Retrotransposon gag domain-containing protein n=1 Tax=Fagus sylvatica TaxID=28930 RepID=A0A2N9GKN7_FAGSY